MRGHLVASTQRWASCMAHAKVPACYALNTQTRAFSGTTPSSSFLSFQTLHSDEMPLGGVATRIGEAFGPALDAIAEQSRREPADAKKTSELFVPTIPHALPVTRWARDNEFIRSVLVIDEKKRVKPRLSWYDPYDTTWVPSGWFAEGVMADMNYYFADEKANKP